jgi:hypothetical protein
MPEHCTILGPLDDPEGILKATDKMVKDSGIISVKGPFQDWSSIEIQSRGTSLVLNRQIRREGGDGFSRMVLGMHNFFRRVNTSHTATKERVLRSIESANLAVGVVAEPAFDEDAGHFDIIFGLTDLLDAVIWNGSAVLDARGSTILDGEGESEVQVP